MFVVLFVNNIQVRRTTGFLCSRHRRRTNLFDVHYNIIVYNSKFSDIDKKSKLTQLRTVD